MKVIDFRFRPNTPEVINGIANSAMFKDLCEAIDFHEQKPEPFDKIIEGLNKNNVVKAVITGRDCETTYASMANGNGSLLDFCTKAPEKYLGFWGIDPHKGMAAIRDLQQAVTENETICGAAIDPYLAKIYANDAKYYPVYAKCCELDIPIIMTTGTASFVPGAVIDHVAPRYIDFVARDFPELKIIMSHGGYPWVNESLIVAQRNKNVYLEFSEYELWPMASAYVEAANNLISDKIMFASAHPFIDYREQLEKYAALPFEDDVREKVMYGNAARLLGL
ncbi:amidohydrolase family protein [Pseudodesulfovibrio thermohalotolerans]|uniref:amidohydrolase family protein n=1 Tax=Pseudodesulfovibrio thermohalotolerans TaxID=2880651 RepID=UPI00244321A5|nr:amidohydrolase family protein [Pseudodesulfovibrio thermohalotolerans]WFS61640.1 amidohydrolase family protein [Pseudodesulfovibrio thermohalotolerans]